MPLPNTGSHTIFAHGNRKLAALCEALKAAEPLRAEAHRIFRLLTARWGDAPLGAAPTWPSDITDDHSPYEFSLAIERHRPELRMLVEAQPERPTAFSQWEAGLALSEAIGREPGVSLDRLHAIEDLFAVEDPTVRFGMWHAVNLREGAAPNYKVYLNPHAKGKGRGRAVVEAALARLGLAGAANAMPGGAGGLEDVKYFSLDMSDSADARVKVYLAPPCATVSDIESALAVAASYVPDEAAALCRAMVGHEGPYSALEVQLCFSFVGSGGARPAAATIYFPVRAYVPSDAVARDRILAYMAAEDRQLYADAISAFAGRDLDAGTGMQTFTSYRRQGGVRRVTVYLSPEVYGVGPRRPESVLAPVSGVVPTPGAQIEDVRHVRRA